MPARLMPVSMASCHGRPVVRQARIDSRAPSDGVNRARSAAREIVDEQRCEHDDGARHPGGTKLFALLHRRDAKTPRVETLQRPRDRYRAEPVCIRLHHGQEWHAGARRVRGSVLQQRAEVDIDPGARVQSVH